MSRHNRLQGSNLRGGFLTLTDLKRVFDDPFKALADLGNLIQTGIDKAAPYTSKIAGPLATALTGVPIPNPGDFQSSNSQVYDAAVQKGKAGLSKIAEKNETILQKLLDGGLMPDKTGMAGMSGMSGMSGMGSLNNRSRVKKVAVKTKKYSYGKGMAVLLPEKQ